MTISVIGAGVLGKTYGGLLALGGHDVHFLMRSDHQTIKGLDQFTLAFNETQQNCIIHSPKLHNTPDSLPPSDIVLITLKTVDNHHLKALLCACMKENSILVMLQNGLGNEEWLAQHYPQHPILCAVSSMAAKKTHPAMVDVPLIGQLRLAPFSSQFQNECQALAKAFSTSPVELCVKLFENHKPIRWEKVAWNCCFGLTSIIFRQPTNILSRQAPYALICQKLIQEIISIAQSEGVRFPDNFMEKTLRVTDKVKNFFPSLYRDFYDGKPIEKEYIVDNLIAIARKNDIPIPFLTLLEKHLDTLLELQAMQQCRG